VQVLTLDCTGPCADVEAVATGGNPPYSFAWDDGFTSPKRHLCPSSSTSYAVSVSDTGTTGELAQPAETARATLAASVIACPDGGSVDGASGEICLSNPSFEGTLAPTTVDAPPWVSCVAGGAGISNDTQPSTAGALPRPTDGSTYLGIGSGGSVSEPLCAPMHAGTTYALSLDLAALVETFGIGYGSAGGLQIWGGASSCSQAQLLWSSPPASSPAWTTFCATLAPAQDTTYLTLAAYAPPGEAGVPLYVNVLVDHLVPATVCH
jgi:hypothetical protein